jgi:hypothetical protein
MVSTTCEITALPLIATSEADCASQYAYSALSAFCLTVFVSSCIDATVVSGELACCSVRDERSWFPFEIWLDAVAIMSVPLRTSPTIFSGFRSFWQALLTIGLSHRVIGRDEMRSSRSLCPIFTS